MVSLLAGNQRLSLVKVGSILLILAGAIATTDILASFREPGVWGAVLAAFAASMCYALVFILTPSVGRYTTAYFRSFAVSAIGLLGCVVILLLMPQLWYDLGENAFRFGLLALLLGVIGQTLPVITLMKGLPITGGSLGGVLASVELPIAVFSSACCWGIAALLQASRCCARIRRDTCLQWCRLPEAESARARRLKSFAMITLKQLNTLPQAEFVSVLAAVYEHSPWVVAAAANRRPFVNLKTLQTACEAALCRCGCRHPVGTDSGAPGPCRETRSIAQADGFFTSRAVAGWICGLAGRDACGHARVSGGLSRTFRASFYPLRDRAPGQRCLAAAGRAHERESSSGAIGLPLSDRPNWLASHLRHPCMRITQESYEWKIKYSRSRYLPWTPRLWCELGFEWMSDTGEWMRLGAGQTNADGPYRCTTARRCRFEVWSLSSDFWSGSLFSGSGSSARRTCLSG